MVRKNWNFYPLKISVLKLIFFGQTLEVSVGYPVNENKKKFNEYFKISDKIVSEYLQAIDLFRPRTHLPALTL